MRKHLLTLACAALLLAIVSVLTPLAAAAEPPNVIVILTDDARWDSLWAMPNVQARLADEGITFTNAYVTTPLCCPFRGSFLSGGFQAHEVGPVNNQAPNHGVLFRDTGYTLALALQGAGYTTALMGKYIQGYFSFSGSPLVPWFVPPTIPPGWTRFFVNINNRSALDNNVPVDGLPSKILRTPYWQSQALSFISEPANEPFFLYLAITNPHYPATPHPEDEGLFPDFVYRGRAYLEQDMSDKPPRIQAAWATHSSLADSIESEDEFHRDQLRSLQAADRLVGALLAQLEALQLLDNTYVFFLSDNGFMWGEHGLFKKSWPYEESVRVPLLVRGPGIGARSEGALVAANLDVPATILELAGRGNRGDGSSLAPFFSATGVPWRSELLLQQYTRRWASLRIEEGGESWKYTSWCDGSEELYDLVSDPYEDESCHGNPACAAKLAELSQRLTGQPGLMDAGTTPPTATVGVPYSVQLEACRGGPATSWALVEGAWPAGLSLSPDGLLSGTPVAATEGSSKLLVVRDVLRLGRHSGKPQAIFRQTDRPAVVLDSDDHDGVDVGVDNCPEAYNPLQEDADLDDIGDACDVACGNGIDDDGDGMVDLVDPGCLGSSDASEKQQGLVCDDGLDQDRDLLMDHLDPGCSSPSDGDEIDASLACDDGLDNDGDGLVDTHADPGCRDATAVREDPQCQDGINNDPGQDPDPGLIDFDGGLSALGYVVSDPDPQCVGLAWKNKEKTGCGIGFELALILPGLMWLHRRRRRLH